MLFGLLFGAEQIVYSGLVGLFFFSYWKQLLLENRLMKEMRMDQNIKAAGCEIS